MQTSEESNRPHAKLAVTIHWAFTVLYGYGIFNQIGDLSELKDRSVLTSEIYFALVFLLLVTIRYLYM